jgi:uncharacterized protein YggT (Ycf19 family)
MNKQNKENSTNKIIINKRKDILIVLKFKIISSNSILDVSNILLLFVLMYLDSSSISFIP